MPHYGWAGPGELRQLDLPRAKTPEVERPQSPSDPIEGEKTKLHVCTVDGCGKKFKKAMLVARHFNSSHGELREDKDTWREWREEVWE